MIRRVSRVLLLVACFGAVTYSASPGGQLPGGAVTSQAGNDFPDADSDISTTSKNNFVSHTSVTERLLANMRTPIGFSVGMFELYVPDSAGGSGNSTLYTMLRPRIFTARKTKRSQLQIEYSFGYRRDNRQSQVHSSEHSTIANFSYQLSRNMSLHISDDFRSALNDRATLPSSSTAELYQPSFAQGLYLPGERSTTNSVVGSLTYQAGKRSNITVFSTYDLWRYGASTFGGAHGIQAGIRSDLQINKWLFFDSSYSHYLNAVPGRFQSANIHRLQVGGFKFKPSRTVELYVSGGADSTRFQERQRTTGSIQGGISRTSRSTLLSLVYHRGFSIAVGPEATLNGDIVSASASQWLSRRVSIQAGSSYTHGASLNKDSKVEYLGVNAELQVVLQRHLMFSTQYSYVSQHGRNLPSDNLLLNRYTITSGLQFVLPSLGGRETSARY